MRSRRQWLLLLFFFLRAASETSEQSQDEKSCEASGYLRLNGEPLLPADLPSVRLYSDWTNSSVTVQSGKEQTTTLYTATGNILQAGDGNTQSQLHVLKGAATREEAQAMLRLLHDAALQNDLDADPDTVDGFATQEFFLDNDSLRAGKPGKENIESPEQMARRKDLREALHAITQPILEERIVPFVNQQFSDCQKSPDRRCMPCYSLLRRYKHGERQSHAPHRDGHSLVTVVVSLSEYGVDYQGGLYVASEFGHKYFLGLEQGDAAVHQSDLLHGVQVYPPTSDSAETQRWSWVLWFRDSEQCDDHGHEWFLECAKEGNPTCEMLQSTKVGTEEEVVGWNMRAAEHGHPTACVKLARAYLKKIHSSLPYDAKKATELFERAVQTSNEPDAHYGLASLYLDEMTAVQKVDPEKLKSVVMHLETSAYLGHPFAMFNLGMVHLYGYGGVTKNMAVAAEWFETSGLPEGLAARALFYESTGEKEQAAEFQRRALSLGFSAPWRVPAREHTGYGGAGGVDLNLAWPPNDDNQLPPKW